MSDSNTSSSAASALDMLTIMFIGLKLGEVIDWSWWFVFMPLIVACAFKVLVNVVLWKVSES